MPLPLLYRHPVKHQVRNIAQGLLRFTVLLLSLGLPALAQAGSPPPPLMDSIEFYQDGVLEATIDVTTAIGYRPRNGLQLSFAGANIADLPGPIITGDSNTGYTVNLNTNLTSIPYDIIAFDIYAQIDEFGSATVRTAIDNSAFNPSLQPFPPPRLLFTENAIPEPSSLMLLAILCGALCAGRRRLCACGAGR